MKTAIKITAIAVITVLIALACSDDVSLTTRSYKEFNESKKAEYTNSPRGSSYEPSLSSSLYYSSTVTLAEEDKEITISFPDGADILKATNADMDAKLNEFLSIFKYSNPGPTPNDYTPSTIGEKFSYTFARREGDTIIIKLHTVPNINRIAYKIDASTYKVFGQVLDFNGDGVGGESYDDLYGILSITGGSSDWTGNWTSSFNRPEQTIQIEIDGTLGGTFDNTNTTKLELLYNSLGYGASNAQTREILNIIKGKLELQKYNKGTNLFEKVSGAELYEYNGTAASPGFPVGWNTDRLYVKFTPDDLGIYRIYATGIANLASTSNIGAKPAKIQVYFNTGTPNSSDNYYKFNSGYSALGFYTNDDAKRQEETASPVDHVVVKSDNARKNVVLEVYFNGIEDFQAPEIVPTPPPGDPTHPVVYLDKIQDVAEFNKAVKLGYNKANTTTAISAGGNFSGSIENIVELKIDKVEYVISKQEDGSNNNQNCIIITLDPAYQLTPSNYRKVSLLLSPDFKYGGGHIIFGTRPSNTENNITNSFYKGNFFWRSYGFIVNL